VDGRSPDPRGELVHVGVPRLLGAEPGAGQRLGQLLGDLADLEGELTTLLAR